MRLLALLCSIWLALGCASAPAARQAQRLPSGTVAALHFEPFAAASFARAAREHRLLLLSVQADWCHWCHVMNAETYRDPEVVALLERHFVLVRVDADARPDIAARYIDWGWPATALLTPDAQPIVNLRGYRAPREFAALLRALAGRLERGERLNADAATATRAPTADSDLATELTQLRAQIDAAYDVDRGGYGGPKKYPWAAPVQAGFLRAALGETAALERAFAALEQYALLLDPVAGGMFQYSVFNRWDRPHYEKIHSVQADALQLFAQAYRVSADSSTITRSSSSRWLERARSIARYLLVSLRAPDGSFYANQDADVGHPGAPGHMTGEGYYALDAGARARTAAPRIDHNVYANYNGMSIAALCALYEAAPDPELLAAATRAFERIEAGHAQAGLYRHAAAPAAVLYLADQVRMGEALFALHQVSADPRYFARLELLVAQLRAAFEDDAHGGFFDRTADPDARGVLAARQRQSSDNSRAARLLLRMQQVSGETAYRELAVRVLRSMASAASARGLTAGDYLLALESLHAPHAVLTVVGAPEDARSQALYRAALAFYHPTRLVRLQPPATSQYPYPGEPVLYLCDDNACSLPIKDIAPPRSAGTMPLKDPHELAKQVSAFIGQAN